MHSPTAASSKLLKLRLNHHRICAALPQVMYVHNTHSLAPAIFELAERCSAMDAEAKASSPEAIDTGASRGVSGFLLHPDGDVCPPVLPAPFGLGDDITANDVLCAVYKLPPHKRHEPRIMVRASAASAILPRSHFDLGNVLPRLPPRSADRQIVPTSHVG